MQTLKPVQQIQADSSGPEVQLQVKSQFPLLANKVMSEAVMGALLSTSRNPAPW